MTSELVVDPAEVATPLHRSASRLIRGLRVSRPAEGLSLARLGVLGRLHRKGTATATALAAYLRIQPQSLTRVLADLARRGLITRRADAADRRRSLIEITEAGRQLLLEDVHGRRTRLARAIGEVLTPTEQELLRLAAGLIDRVAAEIEEDDGT